MPLTLPTFQDSLASVIADFQANLIISYGGQILPLDFSSDSALLAFCRAVCLVGDTLYGLVEAVDLALRLPSATGTDLDDLVALLDVKRDPGQAAGIPVKFGRNTAGSSTVVIPTGAVALALDATGTPTIATAPTVQDPLQPPGVAGIIAPSTAATWLTLPAALPGTAGNVSAGTVAKLQGNPIAGVDYVANPAVANPLTAPTATPVGTVGSTTYQYQVVHHGQTGTTLPSPTGQTTTGNATLTTGNKVTVAWSAPTDTTTTDVLKNTGTVLAPVWSLLSTAAAGVSTLDDTGQATSLYTVPTTNTTNAGAGGVDPETDEALRARAPTVLTQEGKATLQSLIDAVAAIPGVKSVWGTDLSPTAGQFTLTVLPTSTPMSSVTTAAVTAAIAATKAAGITGNWVQLTPTPVALVVTVRVLPSVSVPSSLGPAITAALTAYFATLALGAPVYASDVVGAIVEVGGVASVTISTLSMTPSGGSPATAGADVPGVAGTLFSLGATTLTITA